MVIANNYLDNRELAILIWLVVFSVWALSRQGIRESLGRVVSTFFKKAIFVSTCLMFLYVSLMIYLFYRAGLWDITLLSDTIIWVFGVAFVMYMNISRTKEKDYFKKAILDNLKLIVVLEFISNLYVFDLWVEILLVPILAILGGILAVSSNNPQYKKVETCSSYLVAIIGLIFVVFAIYNIAIDFSGFASGENLKEFLLPFVFTILYLPFIYIMALYITYEQIFMRIRYLVKDKRLARYARWKTVLSFRLRLKSLNEWHDRIIHSKFHSREDVKKAILEVKASGG